jgi:predicted outer membrane repeat protein
MSQQHKSSSPPDPALEITRSILTEAAQRPWLAALLMRRRPDWLTRLAQLAQRVRDLPRHTRRALRRKLASGLAAAALLLALTGAPVAYAGNITVDGTTCTLANAITTANTDVDTGGCTDANPGETHDTITLSANANLASVLPAITSTVTIEGGGFTISGNNTFRILKISSGAVTLKNATISGGSADKGGGIYISSTLGSSLTVMTSTISGNSASVLGGGIYNSYNGTLTVVASTISGNSATDDGGGIESDGVLTVKNSTISGNQAHNGGGILNFGTMSVQNSTLNDNTAIYGGGILNNGGTLSVTNSTLSGNSAVGGAAVGNGGGINSSGALSVTNSTIVSNTASGGIVGMGGGIYSSNAATVQNSIVAGNTASTSSYSDCSGITSLGYNIESAETCSFTGPGDQQDVTPGQLNLGPLNLNTPTRTGTKTHALLSGSVAIDQITTGANIGCPADVTLRADQRGAVRAGQLAYGSNSGGLACDIGAFELDSIYTPNAITLHDLTATANTAPGIIGAMGAALAALGALWVGRRRLKAR